MPNRIPSHRAPCGTTRDPRPTSNDRGYGARWRKLRAMILRRDPLCMICQRAASTCVDHKVSKANGGTDHEDNLQGLCASCHSRKTAKEDGGFGR